MSWFWVSVAVGVDICVFFEFCIQIFLDVRKKYTILKCIYEILWCKKKDLI